jgi:hypothetical protein
MKRQNESSRADTDIQVIVHAIGDEACGVTHQRWHAKTPYLQHKKNRNESGTARMAYMFKPPFGGFSRTIDASKIRYFKGFFLLLFSFRCEI